MMRIVLPNDAIQCRLLASGKFGPDVIVPSKFKISVVGNLNLPGLPTCPPVNQMESPPILVAAWSNLAVWSLPNDSHLLFVSL